MDDTKKVEDTKIPKPIMQEEVIQIQQRLEKGIYAEAPEKKTISTRDVNITWENYMNNGWLDGKVYQPGPFNNIKNKWRNQPCFIIGSGPDLKIFIQKVGWDFLDGKHTIGINHTIESYDRFEWFIFLDRRFLQKTTYDLNKFKGKIFAQNNTGITSKLKNVVRYRCNNSTPTTNIENGLYSSKFSGLVALNLAIIAGANPIFLIGFGMGKNGTPRQFHFRTQYQGVGQHPDEQYKKYIRVYSYFKKFQKWSRNVIHVTEGKSLINDFKKISFNTFKEKFSIKGEIKKNFYIYKNLQPKIVHLSFSDNIEIHADITRAIIKNCYGNHSLHNISQAPKWADLYITEHFISTNNAINTFPYKNKTINIVHSMSCIPSGNFLCNITLTNSWKNHLASKGVQNIKVIYGGIDLEPYKNIIPNFEEKIFGRITRWSPGKIPIWWNEIVKQILDQDTNIKCLMFINNIHTSRPLLKHDRMEYDQTCKINDFKGNWLKRLGVYVHANGIFRETMSHAIIEAMATGLPIIYMKEDVISEVTGNAGIAVNNSYELKSTIIKLLYDDRLRRSYSVLSKNRSYSFDIRRTVNEFDKLIKEVLGEG